MQESAELYEDLSIVELVKLARKGCEMASNELYKRFWRKLKKMCIVYYIPEHDHDDLMDEVYINVFARIDKIKPERFAGYITTAMRNRIINYIAERDRKNKIFTPEGGIINPNDDDPVSMLDVIGEDPPQGREIDSRMIKKLIDAVLAGVKKKYSDIILVILIEGHSYKEAAEILGINPKNVGPRLFRARMKFIAYLKKKYPGWYDEFF